MKNLISLFTVLLFILSGCLWFSTDTYADETKSSDSETTASETVPETQASPVILPTDKVSTDDIILYSSAACVIDVDSGEILYYKNMDDRHYPASITKVLTGLLLIENANLDDTITFSQDCWNGLNYYNDMNIGILNGEQLTVNDALHAILMSSANEVCNGAAKFVSGSVSAFCDLMNDTAQEIGAVNTHFANPDGFHDDNHYTTAMDMALISRYALTFPNIRLTVSKPAASDLLVSGEAAPAWQNSNSLIKVSSSFYYPYANGLKTGFTSGAGYCLSASAMRDGMELIAVVMGAETSQSRNAACKSLLDYGFANFAVVSPDLSDCDNQIPVRLGKDAGVSAVPEADMALLIDKAQKSGVTSEVTLEPTVTAPVSRGQRLGTLTVKSGDLVLKEVPLVAAQEVERLSYGEIYRMVLMRAAMAKADAP